MSDGFEYNFPALRGVQARQEYYVAMCPLKLLPRLFAFDNQEVPAELRAQRTMNSARIPEIHRYIVENRESYAFSAITVSIDGDVRFEPRGDDTVNPGIGVIHVPMTARFVLNDGQHRRAAVESALEEDPDLGDETIAVVFFRDAGLRRSQQLFADLNKHAVKPTKSISVLYDRRDPLAGLARELAQSTPPFKGLTEMEKTTISNRSLPLFTLSAIYQANLALLGKRTGATVSEDEGNFARRYWTALTDAIPEWRHVVDRSVKSSELRRDYIHAHGVTLHALGIAGHRLVKSCPDAWAERLKGLSTIDWQRANTPVWEGRAMTGGQMSKARQNVQLTANLLIRSLGLSLTKDELAIEKKVATAMNDRHSPDRGAR